VNQAELLARAAELIAIRSTADRPDELQRALDFVVDAAGPGVTVERREKGGMAPTFLETQPDDWQKILALNVWGMLHCCHAVLPGMRERRWGRIVNIMSEAGRAGEARLAVYSGAKAAMLGFAKAIGELKMTMVTGKLD
jgi:NAD(P)-dependent dehydrogenase (short-subunit alcohol dehydrogenase family)